MTSRNNQGVFSIPIASIYGFSTVIYNAVAYIASTLGIVPSTDNAVVLGTSTQRWSELHAVNINTTAGENTNIGNSTGTVTLNGTISVPHQSIQFTATTWPIPALSNNYVPLLPGVASGVITNGVQLAPFTHFTAGGYSAFQNMSSNLLCCKLNVYTLMDNAATGTPAALWFRGNGTTWSASVPWVTLNATGNNTGYTCEGIAYIPAGTGFVLQTWNSNATHAITCSNTIIQLVVL